jgi:hypothetical protein
MRWLIVCAISSRSGEVRVSIGLVLTTVFFLLHIVSIPAQLSFPRNTYLGPEHGPRVVEGSGLSLKGLSDNGLSHGGSPDGRQLHYACAVHLVCLLRG